MIKAMTSHSHKLLVFMKIYHYRINAADQAIKDARDKINIQYSVERNTIYKDSCVPVCIKEQLIKQLNQNSSPDMDGAQQDI